MKQRWTDRETPSGLLNLSVNDITYDSSRNVKRRILKACNECAYSGYNEDKEFATLLDAQAGKPLKGYHLLMGTQNEVDISSWSDIINNAIPLSLIVIHNHTIMAPFSLDDINTFLSHPSLKSAVVTVGEHAYYLEKKEDSVCDYDRFIQKAVKCFPGESHFKNKEKWDNNKVSAFLASIFSEFGIIYRRWS